MRNILTYLVVDFAFFKLLLIFCRHPLFISDLMGQGVVIRIGRFPGRTPLGARPGLGTQPRCKAPSDPRVEYVKRKWLTSGNWSCLLDNGPKLAVGQRNSSYKKGILTWYFPNVIQLDIFYRCWHAVAFVSFHCLLRFSLCRSFLTCLKIG